MPPGPFSSTQNVTITLTGLPNAQAAVARRSAPTLTVTLRKANKAAGNVLKPIMQVLTPIVTGVLARSTKLSSKADGSVNVRPTAPHRHLVIQGTRRGVEPNPYVDRAGQMASGPMRAVWTEVVTQDVRR